MYSFAGSDCSASTLTHAALQTENPQAARDQEAEENSQASSSSKADQIPKSSRTRARLLSLLLNVDS